MTICYRCYLELLSRGETIEEGDEIYNVCE